MFKKIFSQLFDNQNPEKKVEVIFSKVTENRRYLENIFHQSMDVIFYESNSNNGGKALFVYIDGLVNYNLVNRDIIKPFIVNFNKRNVKNSFYVSNINETNNFAELVTKILEGNIAIFIDGFATAFLSEVKEWEKREVESPDSETIIRGPKEGFIETLKINIALLRRKIKNHNLVFEPYQLGRQTKTTISIAYFKGIANEELLGEIRQKITSIETDAILESGYIEQFLVDKSYHLFPIIGQTQKPDVAAAKILEGRIAILCDGTPHILTLPHLFIENFQTSEDYYINPLSASLLRIIRIISLLINAFALAVYVMFQTFHQEMIPLDLLVKMASAMEGVPFPSIAEALFMATVFEVLRESGTRLPKAVGSAVSIVGTLVIGESAVAAAFVSSTVIIIVGATAIASFTTPNLSDSIAIIRFLAIIAAGLMGLYGLAAFVFMLSIHLTALNSFSTIYTWPLAPINYSGLKDSIVKFPLKELFLRPMAFVKNNLQRQKKPERKE